MGPVGNLKIFFGLTPQRGGYNFGKTKKSKLSPIGLGRREGSFCGTFCHFFYFFWGGIVLFNGPSGARPVKGLAS